MPKRQTGDTRKNNTSKPVAPRLLARAPRARKVVQFSVTAGSGEHLLYALAADGSMWLMRTHLSGDGHYMPWQRIDPLPRAKVRQ